MKSSDYISSTESEHFRNNVAATLKELRDRNKLTQYYVGKQLGISGVSVGNWEKGKSVPTFSNLRKLLRLYNVPWEVFWALVEIKRLSYVELFKDDEYEQVQVQDHKTLPWVGGRTK